MLLNHRKQFLKLAEEHRLPALYDDKNFVEPGGLMSYGTDRADLFRRAAVYVDKILKGAKPADLPVEQPMKFEFVINLENFKRAAYYVDRILKGAKPADLAVEQPMKLELVFNLSTAKEIGLTIPPNVLARADRIVR